MATNSEHGFASACQLPFRFGTARAEPHPARLGLCGPFAIENFIEKFNGPRKIQRVCLDTARPSFATVAISALFSVVVGQSRAPLRLELQLHNSRQSRKGYFKRRGVTWQSLERNWHRQRSSKRSRL